MDHTSRLPLSATFACLAGVAAAAHSAWMLRTPLRRAARLLLILAFLVGGQVGVMSMAAPGMAMTAMASDVDPGPCKGCAPSKMTIADCGAVCVSMVAVVPSLPASFAIAGRPAWTWSDESAQRCSRAPDSAPPRS